jgi:hypothetical protein
LGPQRSQKRPGEASCTIHCTSSSTVCPRHRAGPGEHDVSDLPGRVLVFSRRSLSPSNRALEVTSPETAHAPAAKTPYAPPALTFGRPGKQKVKFVNAECFLPSPVRHLCRDIRLFTGFGFQTGPFRRFGR